MGQLENRIVTIVTDERHGMRFHLLAERPLSLPEAVQQIRAYMRARPRWMPHRGVDVTIDVLTGASPEPGGPSHSRMRPLHPTGSP